VHQLKRLFRNVLGDGGYEFRCGKYLEIFSASLAPALILDTVYLTHGYGAMNPELSVGHQKGIDDQGLISTFTIDPETGATGMRNNFVRVIKDGKIISFPT
jgi:thiosulfate reductase/polysulfide reductase chain A